MDYILKCLSAFLCAIYIAGCTASVPVDNVTDAGTAPEITPDYTGIVIPPNIAPMNFEIVNPGKEYVTRITGADGGELTAAGRVVKWNIDDWHKLLEANRGKTLDYEVYVKDDSGKWKRYTFSNTVAPDDIDPYISYRLIEPSYEQYALLTINQRDLTSFDEDVVFNNTLLNDDSRGFCINCHVPRNQYRDGSSQFHVRQFHGGTVLMTDGKVRKVNLKTDSTLAAGVYPAWHPTLNLIAYSVNTTKQRFFSVGDRKVEVYDTKSNMILYDIDRDEVRNIAADTTLLETFPAWHPDGKRLYYSVAAYPEGVGPGNIIEKYDSVRYDIVYRDFDPETYRFSRPDTIVNVASSGKSALLPRVSPDGRYLLYSMAPFGTFHIWHPESDLYVVDLETGENRELTEANSDDTESYHSWSSNSRWIVFSSRRDDGSYTRPYITYFSPEGKASKAFVVPQESPDYYRHLMKSYNVPEFFVAPVEVPRAELLDAVLGDACPVKFVSISVE